MSGGILGGFFSPGGQGSGLLGNLNQGVTDNSDSMIGLGLGLMSGNMETAMQGYSAGNKADTLRRHQRLLQDEALQKNTAAKALAQKYNLPPELATDADTVFGAVKAIEMQKRTPKELSFDERQFNMLSPEQQAQYRQQKFGGGATEFGLTPVYGTDAQGRPSIVQLGKNGSARQTPLPEGFNIARDGIKVEGPTGTTILDPQTRQQVGFIPKDVAGAAAQGKIGEAKGAAIAGAPGDIASANTALDLLDQIETHPNRTKATGWESNFPTTKGGKTADFENIVEQAKSGAFLSAIQQMRGMGALSNAEGQAATAAVTRMNLATSDEGFMKAVQDYRMIVQRGKEKAEKLLSQQSGAPQNAPQRLRYDPATGQLK